MFFVKSEIYINDCFMQGLNVLEGMFITGIRKWLQKCLVSSEKWKKKSIIRCLCKYMMTNQIYFVIFMSYVSMTEVRKAKENDYEDSIYNFGISVLWVCDMEYLPIRCEETKSSYILWNISWKDKTMDCCNNRRCRIDWILWYIERG